MAGILETLLKPVTATAGAVSSGLLPYQQKLLEMRGNVLADVEARAADRKARDELRRMQELANQQAPGVAQVLGALPEARGQRGQTPSIGSGWQNLPPELASTMQLLMNPATRQAGLAAASQLIDPQARATLANTRQAGDIAAAQEARAQQLFDPQLRAANATAQKAEVEARRSALEAAAPIPALPYGEPPKGYFPVGAPDGTVQYIPQPGTKPYNDAQQAVELMEETITRLQGYQLLVEKAGPSGTEYSGPLATQLRAERGNIMSAVAALRNLGVLQPGEYELLDEQFPDPTTFGANARAVLAGLDPTGMLLDRSRETIQAPYAAIRETFEERLRNARSTYWYVRHRPGALPEDARR